MKVFKRNLTVVALLLSVFSSAWAQSMEPVSQPKGGRLMDLLGVGDVLLAAQWNTGAVLSSQDGGRSFQSTTFSKGRKSESLAHYKGKVYVSIQDAGVFVSSDKGASFTGPVFFEKHRKYYDLTVAGGKLFVSTGHGLFQFDGSTWSANPGLAKVIKGRYNTRVNASSGQYLALAVGSELWLSKDAGGNWESIPNPTKDQINCFTFHQGTLYAGSYNDGIWTVDLKSNTTAIAPLRDSFKSKRVNVQSLLVNDSALVAGIKGKGCWISKDGGSSWSEAKFGRGSVRPPIHSLLEWKGSIFAGVGTQLYRVVP